MVTPKQDQMRKCKKCGIVKFISDFVPNFTNKKRTYQFRCRDCYNQYHVDWRKKQGDRYRIMQKNRHRAKIAAMSETDKKKYLKSKSVEKSKKYYVLKEEIFAAYGGYKCACCGETIKEFLTIDHINNDGAEMKRKNIHGRPSMSFYTWLKKNNFPPGFQVLCWNCQWGKVKNKGICPHRVSCNDHPNQEYPKARGSATDLFWYVPCTTSEIVI